MRVSELTIVTVILMSLIGCPKAPYTTQELLNASSATIDNAAGVEGNERVKEQVKKFIELFGRYDRSEMKKVVPELYADNAFLNDRIHSVKGRKQIATYFDNTFEKIHSASFEVQDVAYGKLDVYLRWVMNISTDKNQKTMRFLGCSQLRFNEAGQIIYHQDHWDFSELLGEITLIRSIVNYAKSRS